MQQHRAQPEHRESDVLVRGAAARAEDDARVAEAVGVVGIRRPRADVDRAAVNQPQQRVGSCGDVAARVVRERNLYCRDGRGEGVIVVNAAAVLRARVEPFGIVDRDDRRERKVRRDEINDALVMGQHRGLNRRCDDEMFDHEEPPC